MTDVLFILFGVFTIACALAVVVAKQPVYSAFGLILCFFGLAGIYVLWSANFIAMIQILIYTGAILVLFVFVVMLLNLGITLSLPTRGWGTLSAVGVTVYLFALPLLRILNRALVVKPIGAGGSTNLRVVSKLLFTEYLWPFEILSVFLLALMIAIVVISKPDEAGGEK